MAKLQKAEGKKDQGRPFCQVRPAAQQNKKKLEENSNPRRNNSAVFPGQTIKRTDLDPCRIS